MLGRIDSSALEVSLFGLPLDDTDAGDTLAAPGEAEHGDDNVPETFVD